MHHLAGCMHPWPQTCRPSLPHQRTATGNAGLHCISPRNSNWRSPPPAITAGLLDSGSWHCHSRCWPAQQPGSPNKTRWFPPATSAGPLGGCGNCPGSRWSCHRWPWCTSAQGRASTPSAGLGQHGHIDMQPWVCSAPYVRAGGLDVTQCVGAALPVHLVCRTHSHAELYAGAGWQQQQQVACGCAAHPVWRAQAWGGLHSERQHQHCSWQAVGAWPLSPSRAAGRVLLQKEVRGGGPSTCRRGRHEWHSSNRSRVPHWSMSSAAVISSSRVCRVLSSWLPLAPTSAACAWMVVVVSSTMMLPSASKVMPGAVCTSGGREGSRRGAPSLPLTFSCTQGTNSASAVAGRRPEGAGMWRRATNFAAAGRKGTACVARAEPGARLQSIMTGRAQAGAHGQVQRGGHMLVQDGALHKAGQSRGTAVQIGWALAGCASCQHQAGRTARGF